MAIEFRCGQCGKLLRTGDDTAGRMAQCPECGSQTPIPLASEEQEPEQVDVEVIEPSSSSGNPFGTLGGDFFETFGNFGADPYRKQATTSLILGIIGVAFSSILCCCFPVGFFVSAFGIAFGILGLRSPSNKNAAVIGLALSVLGIILASLLFLYYFMSGGPNPQAPFPKVNL
jgi:hypothetical protein